MSARARWKAAIGHSIPKTFYSVVVSETMRLRILKHLEDTASPHFDVLVGVLTYDVECITFGAGIQKGLVVPVKSIDLKSCSVDEALECLVVPVGWHIVDLSRLPGNSAQERLRGYVLIDVAALDQQHRTGAAVGIQAQVRRRLAERAVEQRRLEQGVTKGDRLQAAADAALVDALRGNTGADELALTTTGEQVGDGNEASTVIADASAPHRPPSRPSSSAAGMAADPTPSSICTPSQVVSPATDAASPSPPPATATPVADDAATPCDAPTSPVHRGTPLVTEMQQSTTGGASADDGAAPACVAEASSVETYSGVVEDSCVGAEEPSTPLVEGSGVGAEDASTALIEASSAGTNGQPTPAVEVSSVATAGEVTPMDKVDATTPAENEGTHSSASRVATATEAPLVAGGSATSTTSAATSDAVSKVEAAASEAPRGSEGIEAATSTTAGVDATPSASAGEVDPSAASSSSATVEGGRTSSESSRALADESSPNAVAQGASESMTSDEATTTSPSAISNTIVESEGIPSEPSRAVVEAEAASAVAELEVASLNQSISAAVTEGTPTTCDTALPSMSMSVPTQKSPSPSAVETAPQSISVSVHTPKSPPPSAVEMSVSVPAGRGSSPSDAMEQASAAGQAVEPRTPADDDTFDPNSCPATPVAPLPLVASKSLLNEDPLDSDSMLGITVDDDDGDSFPGAATSRSGGGNSNPSDGAAVEKEGERIASVDDAIGRNNSAKTASSPANESEALRLWELAQVLGYDRVLEPHCDDVLVKLLHEPLTGGWELENTTLGEVYTRPEGVVGVGDITQQHPLVHAYCSYLVYAGTHPTIESDIGGAGAGAGAGAAAAAAAGGSGKGRCPDVESVRQLLVWQQRVLEHRASLAPPHKKPTQVRLPYPSQVHSLPPFYWRYRQLERSLVEQRTAKVQAERSALMDKQEEMMTSGAAYAKVAEVSEQIDHYGREDARLAAQHADLLAHTSRVRNLELFRAQQTHKDMERAAALLQTRWRGAHERRVYWESVYNACATLLQAVSRGYLVRERIRLERKAKLDAAAIVIQTRFKGHRVRVRGLDDLQFEKRKRLGRYAAVLQAYLRGFLIRRANLLERKRLKIRNRAALVIQAAWIFSSTARKHGVNIATKMRNRRNEAALKIQSAFRAVKVNEIHRQALHAQMLRQQEIAVTRIAAAYKGHLDRLTYTSVKEQRASQKQREIMDVSARTIQARFRGHSVRVDMLNQWYEEQKRRACVRIQSVFRGHLSRLGVSFGEKEEKKETPPPRPRKRVTHVRRYKPFMGGATVHPVKLRPIWMELPRSHAPLFKMSYSCTNCEALLRGHLNNNMYGRCFNALRGILMCTPAGREASDYAALYGWRQSAMTGLDALAAREMSLLLNHYGLNLLAQGSCDKALLLFKKAATFLRPHQYKMADRATLQAWTFDNMAKYYYRKRIARAALETVSKAVAVEVKTANMAMLAYYLMHMATVLSALNRHHHSTECISVAARMAAQSYRSTQMAHSLYTPLTPLAAYRGDEDNDEASTAHSSLQADVVRLLQSTTDNSTIDTEDGIHIDNDTTNTNNNNTEHSNHDTNTNNTNNAEHSNSDTTTTTNTNNTEHSNNDTTTANYHVTEDPCINTNATATPTTTNASADAGESEDGGGAGADATTTTTTTTASESEVGGGAGADVTATTTTTTTSTNATVDPSSVVPPIATTSEADATRRWAADTTMLAHTTGQPSPTDTTMVAHTTGQPSPTGTTGADSVEPPPPPTGTAAAAAAGAAAPTDTTAAAEPPTPTDTTAPTTQGAPAAAHTPTHTTMVLDPTATQHMPAAPIQPSPASASVGDRPHTSIGVATVGDPSYTEHSGGSCDEGVSGCEDRFEEEDAAIESRLPRFDDSVDLEADRLPPEPAAAAERRRSSALSSHTSHSRASQRGLKNAMDEVQVGHACACPIEALWVPTQNITSTEAMNEVIAHAFYNMGVEEAHLHRVDNALTSLRQAMQIVELEWPLAHAVNTDVPLDEVRLAPSVLVNRVTRGMEYLNTLKSELQEQHARKQSVLMEHTNGSLGVWEKRHSAANVTYDLSEPSENVLQGITPSRSTDACTEVFLSKGAWPTRKQPRMWNIPSRSVTPSVSAENSSLSSLGPPRAGPMTRPHTRAGELRPATVDGSPSGRVSQLRTAVATSKPASKVTLPPLALNTLTNPHHSSTHAARAAPLAVPSTASCFPAQNVASANKREAHRLPSRQKPAPFPATAAPLPGAAAAAAAAAAGSASSAFVVRPNTSLGSGLGTASPPGRAPPLDYQMKLLIALRPHQTMAGMLSQLTDECVHASSALPERDRLRSRSATR